MKKLLYSAVALATLLFAACQQEKLETAEGADVVTFTVEAPGAIASKALAAGQVIADGTNVNEVHYAVYKPGNAGAYSLENPDTTPLAQGIVPMSEKHATITFDLLKNQDYVVIFWAQVKDAGHYTLGDLRNITVNTSVNSEGVHEVNGNDETRAAFYKKYEFNTNVKSHRVELVRPFAQLNLLTTQESLLLDQPGQTTAVNRIKVLTSEVVVTGLSTTFNTVDGLSPAGTETIKYTMIETPAQQGQEFLEVNDVNYHYVSMNYFFVPEDSALVDVTYTLTADPGDENIQNTIINVPVKENFRTNIIGNLLTTSTDFEIVVDQAFAGYENILVIEDGIVKNVDGTYEITTANGLAYAVNNLFAENGTFYLSAEIYEMSGYNVNPPTVPDGVTINIYGREPELLKSVTSVVGVTIKGLPGALIACVENNARAVISNVRLETASFVKDNDGTVELSNVAVEGAEVSAVDSNDGTLVVAGANLSGKSAVLVNTNNGTAEVSEVTVVGEGAAIAGSNESSITITNSNVVGTDTSLIKDNDGAAVITDSQAETMIAEGDGEVDLIVTVNNFDEFKANLSTATTLRLGENITYEGTYDLTKNVTVDLNGKTFTTGNMSTTWLNIKGAKVTFKNGVIEGKVYVQKNGSTYSNATFEGVTFGGTITFASVTQGSLAVQGGNSVYAKKCTFKGKGSTTPNVVSLESTSSGTVCFEECTFNSTMNRFYANPIGGTAVFKLLNCTFNKAAVVETSASWDLNNMTITGSKSLGVNLYVGKAKDNLTDEEKAILDAYKKNNKGTVYCSGVKY